LPDGPSRPTTEKPALTTVLMVVIVAQSQKRKAMEDTFPERK
jgi:hypothetical protein